MHWWRWTLTPHFAWQYYDNPETPWFFCCRFNWLRLRLFDYTWMRDKTCESPLVIFTLFGVGLVRKRPETWLWRLGEQGE